MSEPETKVKTEQAEVTIKAMMSVPRFGQLAARGVCERALRAFNMPLYTCQGVFWGQCMQRAFQTAYDENVDWFLTIDYDTVFTKHDLNRLFDRFGQNPHIDAMAALQPRRGGHYPLFTCGYATDVEVGGDPIKVTTAHFGLTLLRREAFVDLKKPWFWSKPDGNNNWEPNNGKLDDDIYFWQNWRECGHTIYVDPTVSVGHVEEMVAFYDRRGGALDFKHEHVDTWREQFVED